MAEKKISEQVNEKKEDKNEDLPKEIGGFENKAEPTRYGDWETNGRCSDF